jgi:hypothetical protein
VKTNARDLLLPAKRRPAGLLLCPDRSSHYWLGGFAGVVVWGVVVVCGVVVVAGFGRAAAAGADGAGAEMLGVVALYAPMTASVISEFGSCDIHMIWLDC